MRNKTQKKRVCHTLRKPRHEDSWSQQAQYDLRRIEMWKIPADIVLPLFPFCMEEEIRTGNYWYKDNFTRYLLIVVCMKGNILFRFAERDIVLTKGEVLIVPPGTPYLLQNADEDSSHKVVIEFIGKNMFSDSETLGLNCIMHLKTKEYSKFAGRIREIGDLLHTQNKQDIPLIVGLSYRFCTELSLLQDQESRAGSILHQAQMILESDLSTKISLNELAARLHCSKTLINKLFRQELNTTPLQYRLEKKIACARCWLSSTTLTIKEIAFRLGYCDQFYFSNEFHRITGESPRTVKKNHSLI